MPDVPNFSPRSAWGSPSATFFGGITVLVAIVSVYASVQLMMLLRTILQPLLFAVFLVMILVPVNDIVKDCIMRWCCCSCTVSACCWRKEKVDDEDLEGRSELDARSRTEQSVESSHPEFPPEESCAEACAGSISAFLVLLLVSGLLIGVGIIVFESLVQMRKNINVYQKGAYDLTIHIKHFMDEWARKLRIKEKLLDSMTDDVVLSVREMIFYVVGLLLADLSETVIRAVLCVLYLIFWLCQPIRLYKTFDDLFKRYIMMKSLANLCMALSTGVLLWALAVDMAWLFALLTFLLNYIPEIGPLVAMMIPVPVILFDGRRSTGVRVTVLVAAMTGQLIFKFIFGNFLEMKLIEHDRKMRMHPVIVLLGVAFFGYIWGPTGMLISVPIMAVFKLLCVDQSSPFPESFRHGTLIFMEGDVYAPARYFGPEATKLLKEEGGPNTHADPRAVSR